MALLEVQNLFKTFPIRKGLFNLVTGHVHAVNGVSFSIQAGEKVGLVGESGCGKSTLGKTLVRLWEPSDGRILFKDQEISHLSHAQMLPHRKQLQFIFQDPYGSLNPKMTIFQILREPLRIHNIIQGEAQSLREAISGLLQTVGLPSDAIDKYPHEFSGGQRQRIGIARAIATNPDLIVADEPVSALDVSVQAQIINLLDDLRSARKVAYLFISHDLKVVHHFCERVMVMYLGHIVESMPTARIHEDAKHPYTRALLDAIPVDHPSEKKPRPLLEGDVPSPIQMPPGCPFHTRCPLAVAQCREEQPALQSIAHGHAVACHLVQPSEDWLAHEASQASVEQAQAEDPHEVDEETAFAFIDEETAFAFEEADEGSAFDDIADDEEGSAFDDIVDDEEGSIFDDIVDDDEGSAFDDIVDDDDEAADIVEIVEESISVSDGQDEIVASTVSISEGDSKLISESVSVVSGGRTKVLSEDVFEVRSGGAVDVIPDAVGDVAPAELEEIASDGTAVREEAASPYALLDNHEEAHEEFLAQLAVINKQDARRAGLQSQTDGAFRLAILNFANLMAYQVLVSSVPFLKWLFFLLILFVPLGIWRAHATLEALNASEREEYKTFHISALFSLCVSWYCLISWSTIAMGLGTLAHFILSVFSSAF